MDEHAIKRASKIGELETLWDEIEVVIELKDSYVIKTNRGSMPLPKRVLSENNQYLFKGYAHNKLIRT
ncbi:YcxB family protein [Thalassotalea ponticola]|uniref:YcxB family protein n=1 Tax=Thalassotalea ponticola TaxID=1523392 RepID=UPI00338E7CA2